MRLFITFGLLAAALPLAAAAQEDMTIVTAPAAKPLFGVQARVRPPVKAPALPATALTCPGDVPFFPTGFTFPALLPDAIYSYNTLAPVIALVEDDVAFGGRVVLPKGTRLVGDAGTVHTLDRVNIVWTLAVMPEGCEFPFTGLAMSAEDGSAGVKGKLEKHEDSIAATIALQSVLTGVQAAAAIATPIEGAVTSGFSTEANQMLGQNVSKAKSLESIYVRERTPIKVFVLRRFIRDAGAH